MKELKNKDEANKFSIYVPLLTLSCFFVLVDFHPQWLILITPFVAITIFQNIKNFKINMLLDIASSGAILIVTIFYHYWVYGSTTIDRMILPRIFGSTYGVKMAFQNPSELLTKLNLDKLYPLFLAIYVTCTVAMLIINYPKRTKEVDEKQKIEWGLLFTRMLVIIPVPILMIFCYYYK